MTFGQAMHWLTFDRAYKVVVMCGATVSAVSCVAILLMLAPVRSNPEPSDSAGAALAWTTGAVPVSPEMRARREPERPAPAAPVLAAAAPAAAEQPSDSPTATPVATEAPAAEAPSEPAQVAATLYNSPEVIDGGTLWAEGRVIRLAGIEPLGIDDLCERGRRRVFRCGAQARAALRNLVRRRTVECTAVGGDGNATLARCTIAGKDIAQTMLAQGLAIRRVEAANAEEPDGDEQR